MYLGRITKFLLCGRRSRWLKKLSEPSSSVREAP